LLDSERQLVIKFGADVTAAFLHLGHAVNLWMMREMQERGHKVVFLVGDFTTRIGDPTGNSATRVERSQADIERDAAGFLRQVGRILITDDPAVFEARRNAEWWEGRPLDDFLGLLGSVTVAKLLSRDMFRARMEAGVEIRLHELVYPVLQGWDSVELRSDLTIVGSDQLFNESMGRVFQERQGQRPQVIITTRITPGLDGGKKQSKSLNNFVALDDTPRDMFGKIMQLPDGLVVQWLEVYTTLPLAEIRQIEAGLKAGDNPMAAKRLLGKAVVARLHGDTVAAAEEDWFLETFSGRHFPTDAPVVRLPAGSRLLLNLLTGLEPGLSRSSLRRLVQDGAVELDGRCLKQVDALVCLAPGVAAELRLGRRRYFRLLAEGG